ncbi:puromycin-sensitive aminopeptidase-like [Stylophora pistillata]|uniref:puromycin-sensitive aminopeptidase-like n=1 Tax=Stylophora pistillata TaxID=50429 RepID=UPI000C04BF34|nr:puromycin-sensitive aminopeptidase-like [Stylophora pistillata]
MSSVKKPFERLPASVLPKNYKLTLQPSLTEFTFTGEEVIDVEVKQETDKVIINCLDINVTSASFSLGEQSYPSSSICHHFEDETVEISFASPLPLGQGELCLDFTGELNKKLKGFYRCKYSGEDGSEKFCAVTHFEPTGARRAFPCWDEPAIRATFDITLIVPKDRVALSNMNVKEEKDHTEDTSLKVVKYARTPVMSTYLVAFVVGEFDFVEGKDANGVIIRVYTPKGKAVQGQFALEVAKKCLPFYKEYFGIGYLLPKLDLIAIQDFVIGAMENWGLVTYRETCLLIDPSDSSSAAKQYVALVVGHELAHMWFGNLVTVEWWTHLWLKEGFASWIEYLLVDHCFPEFDVWTQFVSTDFASALKLDALNNSHPIEVPVGHPGEIDEIFDTICYNKGASVIRMLHQYVGNQEFRKGLNHYLKTFEYNAASTEDLWASLSHASSKPVADVMETWTKQMGYPVLSVTAEKKGEDVVVTITQTKFSADGKTEDSFQWKVPIAVCTSTSPSAAAAETLLEDNTCTVTVSGVGKDQWIKLNPGQVGFYRVQYSSDMLDLLLPAIKDHSLPARDRLGLQSDLFALAQAGLTSTTEFLKLAEQYSNETNYTVWNDLTTNMSSLSKLLQNTGFYSSFQAFCIKLYEQIAQKVGWDPKDGEGHLDALLRGLVLGCIGRSGDEATLAQARKRFDAHCKGESTIPADLRSAVYSTVLKHGDDITLESVTKLFKEADLHEEKVRLMRCMGAVSQPELIKKVLEFSMSSAVRSQDTVFVIAGVTGSLAGRKLAWQFVQDNWDELYTRYAGGLLFSRLIKMTTDSFATEKSLKEIQDFFDENSVPNAERTVQQSLENIRLNITWLSRDADSVRAWLQDNRY